MKLELKQKIEAYIQENTFMEKIIIHTAENTFSFPESAPIQTDFFIDIAKDIIKNSHSSAQYAAITQNVHLFIIMEGKTLYICECNNHASLSQIKMEFGMFVNEIKKHLNSKSFLKSIFDW